jgi:hypothetical protein
MDHFEENGLAEFPLDFEEHILFPVDDRCVRMARKQIYDKFVTEARDGRCEFEFSLRESKQDKMVVLAEILQRFRGRLYAEIHCCRVRIDRVDVETVEDEWVTFVLSNTGDPNRYGYQRK